jgi:hypothetical protein
MYNLYNIFFLIEIILFLSVLIFYSKLLFKFYIIFSIILILSITIMILFYKKTLLKKNIMFPSINTYNYNFTYFVINSLILSVIQKVFIIVYAYHSGLYEKKILTWFKIIFIFLLFSLINILCIQIYCLVSVIEENPNSWRKSYYTKINNNLTYDKFAKDWEILIFNGKVKVNCNYNEENNLIYIILDDIIELNSLDLDYYKQLELNKIYWVLTNTPYKHGKYHEIRRLQSEITKHCIFSSINFTYSNNIQNTKPLLYRTLHGGTNTKLYITIDYIKDRKLLQTINLKYIYIYKDYLSSYVELENKINLKKKIKWVNYTNTPIKHKFFTEYLNKNLIRKNIENIIEINKKYKKKNINIYI